VVESHARAVIDVDLVHSARVTADAARVIALEPGYDTAARCVEINGTAGSVIAALSRAGDARTRAMR
jgi:hypothetical protein